jgi:hypothetical protein
MRNDAVCTLLAAIVVAACGITPVPASPRPSYVECFARWGLVVVEHPSSKSGDPSTYTFENGELSPQVIAAARAECTPRLTQADIRDIYDKWVGEWQCLVDAGYRPRPPPEVEEFLVQWTTGPWSPIDGIDTNLWSNGELDRLKTQCGLEFFERD